MEINDYRVLLAIGRSAIAAEFRQDLRAMGFTRIIQAGDGYEALMRIKKEPLDLMLIEDDLPVIDGLDVVRHMRRIPRFVGPRTILVTQRAEREIVAEAAALHVREVMLRPFGLQALKDRIERLLETTLI